MCENQLWEDTVETWGFKVHAMCEAFRWLEVVGWVSQADPSFQFHCYSKAYHGLIKIPGMPGLVRVRDVGQQPIVVSTNVQGDRSLHLGYEDDGYQDNGYWGHDNGTEISVLGVCQCVYRAGSVPRGEHCRATGARLVGEWATRTGCSRGVQ